MVQGTCRRERVQHQGEPRVQSQPPNGDQRKPLRRRKKTKRREGALPSIDLDLDLTPGRTSLDDEVTLYLYISAKEVIIKFVDIACNGLHSLDVAVPISQGGQGALEDAR